ncbi:MAG: YicC/YloC family endoribonuclease [Burkholderiales bacterium]
MTGYAAASVDSPRGRLTLELRSVNARFLDVQFRIAEELRALEPALREQIGARVSRGKVDCRFSLGESPGGGKPQRLNAEALARLRSLVDEARAAFPDAPTLRVGDVLRWPGVIAEEPADEETLRKFAVELCARALDELTAARGREGSKLAETIHARVATMRALVDQIAPLVPQSIAAYQAKITERLKEALGAADDDRVRAELALFSAKADVHEELDRLRTHLAEVERSLRQGGPVGKRLDFLAQELNREANTLAAKSSSQQLSDGALELKLLVEQIREQVQNIE